MGHWYTREGTPLHTVVGKNGKERDTTLRDARERGLLPSVTEILNVLDKPQLTDWKVKQAILAALTLPRIDGESEDAYIWRITHDSRQEAAEAAAEGSRIHDSIEAHFRGRWVIPKYRPHVDGVLAKLGELFPGVDDWVSEQRVTHPSGYGGMCDLHSPSIQATGDFKGKDIAPGNTKRLAYDQDRQLGAYRNALGYTGVGFNLFVSRTHPGHVEAHIWTPEEMDAAYGIFRCCLELWKCLKRYNPEWT